MQRHQIKVDRLHQRPDLVAGHQQTPEVTSQLASEPTGPLPAENGHQRDERGQVDRQEEYLVEGHFLDHGQRLGAFDDAIEPRVPRVHRRPRHQQADARVAGRPPGVVRAQRTPFQEQLRNHVTGTEQYRRVQRLRQSRVRP